MTIIIYFSSFFNLTIFIPAPIYHTKYSYKSHSEFSPAAPAAPHRCGAQAYRQNPPLGSYAVPQSCVPSLTVKPEVDRRILAILVAQTGLAVRASTSPEAGAATAGARPFLSDEPVPSLSASWPASSEQHDRDRGPCGHRPSAQRRTARADRAIGAPARR